MITLYGIPNCDTVKKARVWLEQNGIEFNFHDFRKDGLDESVVRDWITQASWQTVVNKRSTGWRALSDDSKTNMDAEMAVKEILKQPTLVKRPVLDGESHLQFGFNQTTYQELFESNE